jgi:hypothetical protein
MNTVLDINTDAIVKLTNRLEKLGKTTLPNVVRKTLNDAAMDVKRVTMPKASNVFTHRQKNFFIATSRVEFAKNTGDINTMQSSVGFMDANLKGQNNYAVKDLVQQEGGGSIGGRSFIPLPAARVGKSNAGNVRAEFRLSQIMPMVVNAKDFEGKNDKQKFVHAASFVGKGGFVIGTGIEKNFLYKINSVKRVGKNHVVNSTAIYSVQSERVVSVHSTNFMEKASDETTKKIERIFVTNAEARFNRDLKI